jgi:hypothetical protein
MGRDKVENVVVVSKDKFPFPFRPHSYVDYFAFSIPFLYCDEHTDATNFIKKGFGYLFVQPPCKLSVNIALFFFQVSYVPEIVYAVVTACVYTHPPSRNPRMQSVPHFLRALIASGT